MDGRDINSFLRGLYQGGTSLAAGLIDKGQRNKVKDIYDKESDYIKTTWSNSINRANELLSGNPPAPPDAGDYPGTFKGVSDKPESSGAQPFSMSDLYFRKEKGIADLLSNKYGEPYAESLNRLYNDLYGQKKSGWEIKEGKDGEFYAINPETLETKKIITGERKLEKDFKLSGDATIIPYTDDQGNAFYGWFEPDNRANDYGNKGWKHTGVNATQDQIDEFNRSGKYAKKLTGRSPGRSSRNSGKEEKRAYSQEEKLLASDLSKLGQLNKSFNSWYNADPTTETEDQKKAREEYEALKTSLIEYFDGDYDALNLYAEKVYEGTDVPSVIDEILGSADQTDAEEEAIDNIFEDDDMSGEDATLIYEKHKDSFKTKAGQKYFKNKYLNKIGAK